MGFPSGYWKLCLFLGIPCVLWHRIEPELDISVETKDCTLELKRSQNRTRTEDHIWNRQASNTIQTGFHKTGWLTNMLKSHSESVRTTLRIHLSKSRLHEEWAKQRGIIRRQGVWEVKQGVHRWTRWLKTRLMTGEAEHWMAEARVEGGEVSEDSLSLTLLCKHMGQFTRVG